MKIAISNSWILGLAIALIPWYAMESGGMQISHALMFCYCGIYIAKHGMGRSALDVILAALLVLAVLRESIEVMMGAPISTLVAPIHLFYVFIVVNVLQRAFLAPVNVDRVKWGVLFATAFAIAGVLVLGYGLRMDAAGDRSVGTFNNPNQLGYFSVCASCIAAYLRRNGSISVRLFVLFLAGAAFLALASLSKAAMSCTFLVIVLSGFTSTSRRNFLLFGFVPALAVLATMWLSYRHGLLSDFRFVRRLELLGTQSDDSLVARGYDIFSHANPFELLFGLGSREVHDIRGREIHSTIFSFFGNYGIVGGLLFLSAMAAWCLGIYRTQRWIGVAILVAPPMIYGITHNGSRFLIFWLLVSLTLSKSAMAARSRSYGDIDPGITRGG